MAGDAGTLPDRARQANAMRIAMAEYVRTVHQAYLSAAAGQPPGVRARLPLLRPDVTVLAVGARHLHVLATTDPLPAPSGPEVAQPDAVGELRWTLRFYDPVVLPELGSIDDTVAAVRRVLGLSSVLYHLTVAPGAQLSPHQAGHAGTGLAMDHLSAARDFEAIRSRARGREALVDEMEAASAAGLVHAPALLAAAIVPGLDVGDDPVAVRRGLLTALRGGEPRG